MTEDSSQIDSGSGSGDAATIDSGTPSTFDAEPGAPDAQLSDLVITIPDAFVYANCMPVVAPDPVISVFTVRYDNTASGNDTTLTINNARLEFDVGGNLVTQDISLNLTSSGLIPAGESIDVEYRKLQADAPALAGCDSCGGASQVIIRLEFSNGVPAQSTSLSYPCVQ